MYPRMHPRLSIDSKKIPDPTSLNHDKREDCEVLHNIEGGKFENQPLHLIYYKRGGKASSTLSCKKRNFNLKQMNKTEIKLIGRMNNLRPH
jgi:hypothetical protein